MTMEAIITQSPLPTIVLDPLLRVVEVSQTFLNETALLRENCVGVDVFVLLGERSFPQDACTTQLQWTLDIAKRTQTIQRVHQIAIGNHPGSMRVVPILKDDALLYFVLEWHKVTTSVDEQHLEMDEPDSGLSTNEAFKIFVENVNDYAIFLLDTRGCVVTWNKGAELIKQYKRDEIIGKHFSIFYGQTDLQERKPQRELEVCLVDGRIEDEGWR
jgi:osomolarity two-component system sensor histidine kinase TcsA